MNNPCPTNTYPDRAAALAALRSIRARTHTLGGATYRCPTCTQWHLTHAPRNLKKRGVA